MARSFLPSIIGHLTLPNLPNLKCPVSGVHSILHNAVSALLNTEEPVFFIIAIIVCPIGFLVGAIGSIVLTIKRIR
jgi:hypothetical protein